MRAAEYFFSLLDDRSEMSFGCRQRSVSMVRPEPAGSLYSFVTGDPVGLVMSSYPPNRVRQTADDRFCIKVEELNFATLTIAVELDVRCWLQGSSACIESSGFRISGLDGLADTSQFDITVRGKHKPSPPDSTLCCLTGDIEFEARGPLPTLLKGTPEPVLRTAAKAVSEALASAATDRFAKQVPDAYAQWAAKGAAAAA